MVTDGPAERVDPTWRRQHARHARSTSARSPLTPTSSAGVADHISPWQACYRSARLLGSKDLRFVLSSSGHIAALVNPPGNPKASYRTGSADERDPDRWIASATKHGDSWWPDFSAWLAERGGDQKTAPKALGAHGISRLGPAPGSYVHEH